MNINSRTLWTTVVALLVAAGALVAVSAQERREGRQGFGRGQGFGPGPMPMLQRLNLTDAQREQIRGIFEQQGQGREAAARKAAELRQELHAAIFADNPDRAKIDQLKANLSQAEASALEARIETDLKVAEVLTSEQRAQAREGHGRGARGRGPRR